LAALTVISSNTSLKQKGLINFFHLGFFLVCLPTMFNFNAFQVRPSLGSGTHLFVKLPPVTTSPTTQR